MRSCGQHEQSSSFNGVAFLDQFSSISECYLAAYGLLPICGGRSYNSSFSFFGVFPVLSMAKSKMVPVAMLVHLHYYLFILSLIYISRCLISLRPSGVMRRRLFFFRSEKLEKHLAEKRKSPLPAKRVGHGIKKFDLGR